MKKKTNFWLWIVVLVVILIVVYVYINWFNKDRSVENLLNTSSSDEVGAIEQDLQDTDLENLDQELQDIENELNAIQ